MPIVQLVGDDPERFADADEDVEQATDATNTTRTTERSG